ncbi:MAG TPA: hypothetical protein VGD39_21215 [Nocardioides sp.]
MDDQDHPAGEALLGQSRSLREWAVGLCAWSRCAREAASAERLRSAGLRSSVAGWHRHPAASLTPPLALDAGQDDPVPPIGPIRATELLSILVEHHGMGAATASRSLSQGLRLAGYPDDDEEISAADAFDIVERALGHRLS